MSNRLGQGRDLPGGQIASQDGKCASRHGVTAQSGHRPAAPGRPHQHRRCQPPPRPRSAADAKAASDRMNDFAGSLGTSLRVPPGYAGDITERLAAQMRQKRMFPRTQRRCIFMRAGLPLLASTRAGRAAERHEDALRSAGVAARLTRISAPCRSRLPVRRGGSPGRCLPIPPRVGMHLPVAARPGRLR